MMQTQTGNISGSGSGSGIPEAAPETPDILIVDDDPGMRTLLMSTLRRNGFRARGAADSQQMEECLASGRTDLLLLDVMLPGLNGFDICRALRQADDNIPIIMISARGEEADRVAGLELGADDYIAKPFGPSEVLARIRAVLRRGVRTGEQRPFRPKMLRFAGWTVDLPRRELRAPSGAIVAISGAEFDLLVSLLDNAQRVISREALLEMSRARIAGSSDRSIDVLISRLRRKLGDDGEPPLIRTIRGVGYMFVAEVSRH